MNPKEIRELGENIDMYLHYVANLIEEKENVGKEVVQQIANFMEDIRQIGVGLGELHRNGK